MRTNLIKTTLVVNEKPAKEKTTASAEGIHDMIIAFDTTGSMYSYLDAVKKYVTSLIPELLATNPNMRIGVVAFGDYCDSLVKMSLVMLIRVKNLLEMPIHLLSL